MSSDAQERAASARHPIMSSDATGALGVFRLAITTANQSVALPDAMKGKWLDLYNTGTVAVEYGFTIGAAGSVTLGATGNPGAASANGAYPIGADKEKGDTIPWAPANVAVYLNWRASASGGQLVGYVSERAG